MLCKACYQRPTAGGKKQIRIPHPSGKKGHYEIVHEDEDLCPVCIKYSDYSYTEEDLDFTELGLDVPTAIPIYE